MLHSTNMHDFVVGDLVYVADLGVMTYGREGQVTRVDFPYNGNITIRFHDGKNPKSVTLRHEKLMHIEADVMKSNTNNQELYLAFVHYHDGERNPTSIDDAVKLFSTDDLGQPELTIYGTKDDIIEEIKSDNEYGEYEHCFIIVGNRVYPVETEIKVNW